MYSQFMMHGQKNIKLPKRLVSPISKNLKLISRNAVTAGPPPQN